MPAAHGEVGLVILPSTEEDQSAHQILGSEYRE
jgi:hypothetical protein